MVSHVRSDGTRLIVSGGDDGALAFLLAHSTVPNSSSAKQGAYASSPILVNRAHGSAVTASTIVNIQSHIYVLTSGNDEWVRLWEVVINDTDHLNSDQSKSNKLTIKRLSKVKTSVADVSSMAVLDSDSVASRVLVCGVGMEVVRLDPTPIVEDMASQ